MGKLYGGKTILLSIEIHGEAEVEKKFTCSQKSIGISASRSKEAHGT
jgi:hypothetical protein